MGDRKVEHAFFFICMEYGACGSYSETSSSRSRVVDFSESPLRHKKDGPDVNWVAVKELKLSYNNRHRAI